MLLRVYINYRKENPSFLLRICINNRELNLATPGIHQLYREPKLASPSIHQQQRTHPCFSGCRSTTENSTLLLWVYINYTGNPNLLLWVYIITHPCISRKSNLDSPGALNYWEERNLFSLGSFTIMIHAISYAEIILGKVPWDY